MRERGQWLSALYTPHPALYRRYGWEIAGEERWYEFKPKDLRLTVAPSQRGQLRAVGIDDWQRLAAVYDAYALNHNGPLARNELWWRHWVLETWSGRQEAVLWSTDDGRPQGYMLYADPAQRSSRHAGKFVVTELITISSDAYLNLVDFISQQDIREDAVYYAPHDDPLPLLFSDAERLEMHHGYTVLLRVIDVAEALRERAPAFAELKAEFTVRISDSSAPWNEGTWHVKCADGRAAVERTDAPAELSLDARTLAPIFNGYISATQAAEAGLIEATGEDALRRADAFFATQRRPYFTDRF
jgi:predicted acetyltransferase